MPKREPSLKELVASIVLVLVAVVGYRVGIFDAIARVWINYVQSSMQSEIKRQQEQRQAKRSNADQLAPRGKSRAFLFLACVGLER